MFIKFPSLDNLHVVNSSVIDELKDSKVAVMEKIDGSNISIVIEKNGSYHFASRNRWVYGDWNNLETILEGEIENIVSKLVARYPSVPINLYGEVFSSKILRRIPYGNERVAFFHIAVNGENMPASEMDMLVKDGILPEYLVVPSKKMTLGEAILLDTEDNPSIYANANAEGYVIRPLYSSAFNDKLFGIKLKSKAFMEKVSKPKSAKQVERTLEDDVVDYVTNSRLLSVFSKEGEIQSVSEISLYIALLVEDAIEDFSIVHNTETLNLKKLKKVASKKASTVVKNHIFKCNTNVA